MIKLERRFFNLTNIELRAGEDGQRTIAGYAAVFNSLSEMLWGFREKIAPGAFSDVLDGDVRALWNHDTNIVLGRTRAGTLRLKEDNTGLAVEIDAPASAVAQIEALERGDVDQMSFGFNVLPGGDEWEEEEDGLVVRTIRKVSRLYEVSPVTFPAYPATSVGVRNDEVYGVIPEIPAELRRALGSDVDELARARDVRSHEVRKRLLQLQSMV